MRGPRTLPQSHSSEGRGAASREQADRASPSRTGLIRSPAERRHTAVRHSYGFSGIMRMARAIATSQFAAALLEALRRWRQARSGCIEHPLGIDDVHLRGDRSGELRMAHLHKIAVQIVHRRIQRQDSDP